MSTTSPDEIRAWEAGFQEMFGFPARIEVEPGHPQRETPVKVERAAEASQGIIDAHIHGISTVTYPAYTKGLLRKPRWEILYEGFPLLRTLRENAPHWDGGPAGTTFSDFCPDTGHGIWSLNYNTTKVTAEEVKGLAWDDLWNDKWRGRVGMDERALGLYLFPLAEGWDSERLKIYAHNLGANDLKLISGGSSGINQALLQGEIDIGLATTPIEDIRKGAPLDWTLAEFAIGPNPSVSCLPKFGVNDPDMAELFWAWLVTEGEEVSAKITGAGGWLYPEVADKYPLMKKAKELGISPDKLVMPRSLSDSQKTTEWRKVAIDAQLEGIRSKQKLPYPYAR